MIFMADIKKAFTWHMNFREIITMKRDRRTDMLKEINIQEVMTTRDARVKYRT